MLLAKSCWGSAWLDAAREPTHGISVQEKTDSGHENDDPLIVLSINRLIDLLHAYIAILLPSAGVGRHAGQTTYLFMVEIASSIGLI
jgi:hypothetical protein